MRRTSIDSPMIPTRLVCPIFIYINPKKKLYCAFLSNQRIGKYRVLQIYFQFCNVYCVRQERDSSFDYNLFA